MKCQTCKTTKNLHKQSTRKNIDGTITTYYMCNPCNTARVREYRKRTNTQAQRKANHKYEAAHPERRQAWSAVYCANLKKEPCEVCGAIKVHAHHPVPKKKLSVRWLCPLHHKQEHLK